MRAKATWAVLLAFVAAATFAAEGSPDFRIGPRVGPGELRINAGERIGDEVVRSRQTEDTIGLGGTLEYRPIAGVVLETGVFRAGSSDWFDSDDYIFTEYFGSLGYQFDLGRGFSITPRVGRARWKLETDDVWFFADDDDPPTTRGYQNYWEVTAMKRINDIFSLGVSHKENHHDFGRVRSTVFTVMFDL